MRKYSMRKGLLIGCLLFALITGCSTATPEMPEPEPTPMQISCEEVEGDCIELTFDGESCSYAGPEQFNFGPVTFIFINDSDIPFSANMIRLLEDKTYQDLIDYAGEQPSSKPVPTWSSHYPGVRQYVDSGHVWTGDLKPGIHALFCVGSPGIWLGGGFTVVE